MSGQGGQNDDQVRYGVWFNGAGEMTSSIPIRISVIIPTIGRPDYLTRSIQSVGMAARSAGLDSHEVEVLVVDDGHSPETLGVVSEALTRSELQGKLLLSPGGPRAGPSVARHHGIFLAVGDLIYLLDDDDEFLPNRFQQSLNLLRSGEADVVLEPSLRVYVNDPSKDPFITGPYGNPGNAFMFLMTGGGRSHITPGATAFHKSLYHRVGGYDQRLRYGEDGELLLRFCLHGKASLLDGDPVVKISIHDDNSTRLDRIYIWHSIKSLSCLLGKMRKGNWPEETAFVRRALSGKLDFALSEARLKSLTYRERIYLGSMALQHFDWRCMTIHNLKSIAVWLIKPAA